MNYRLCQVARTRNTWLTVFCLCPVFKAAASRCVWSLEGCCSGRETQGGPPSGLTCVCDFWKLIASKVLVCLVQVFAALARHLVGFDSLICLMSLAVQALKLGKLGFITVVGEGRERSCWQGWEGRCCSWTSEQDIVSVLSR